MHGAKIIHKCLGLGVGGDKGLERPPSLQLTSPQLLIPHNGFLHTLNCHNEWNWHETFKTQIRDKRCQKTPDHTHAESKHFPNGIVKNKEQVG